jgi:hypothetical protein
VNSRAAAGIAASVILAVLSSAKPAGGAPPIKAAGPCHVVRGRLAIWNGNPAVRIWPVGTNRMLGVATAEGEADGDGLVPRQVQRLIDPAPEETVVYGDYEVCPLTRLRPGRMQMVFIAKAAHLTPARR